MKFSKSELDIIYQYAAPTKVETQKHSFWQNATFHPSAACGGKITGANHAGA